MRRYLVLLLSVLLTSVTAITINRVTAEETPITKIFTDPLTVQATEIGQIFIININISNVVDLYAWQTGITFNPEVLECTGFYEGEFLTRRGRTVFCEHWKDMNNTLGIVYFRGCCPLGSVPGVNGSGQLAYVTFKSVGTGISDFYLTDIILLNSELKDIRFEVVERFTVQVYGVDYGVEITNNLTGISDAPDPPQSGTFNPSFNQQEKKISFDEWSSKDWFCKVTVPKELLRCDAMSDWTIEVDGTPVSYTATENDTHTSLYFTYNNGTHIVQVIGSEVVKGNPYDLNNDSTIDMRDIAVIAVAYGSRIGEPRWNPMADIAPPYGEIDIHDLVTCAVHYGETV